MSEQPLHWSVWVLIAGASAVLVALVIVGFAGCAPGWDDVPASATAPSKDYPCGVIGVPCTDATGHFNHTCCWEGETCGSSQGSVGCPADACCDIRDFDPSPHYGASPSDGGATMRMTHAARPTP